MQHIFLDQGVLKFTTESIPEKPAPVMCDFPLREATSEEIDRSAFKNHLKEWEYSIASIKARGVVVGNADEVMAMRNMRECGDWVRSEDVPKENVFYSIACEVKYDEEVCEECGLAENEDCQNHPDGCEDVVILSPVATQAESDDEYLLWLQVMNKMNGDKSRHIESGKTIEALKSKYTLTRKKQ